MVLVPGGRPSGTLAVPVGHRAAVMLAGTWKARVHSGMGAMGRTKVWESLAQVGGGWENSHPREKETRDGLPGTSTLRGVAGRREMPGR